MRNLILLLLIFNFILLSAQENNLNIESHWISITKQNGKYVLYEPCNAEISQIVIDGGKHEMIMHYGQENEIFKILASKHISVNELDLTILYTVFEKPRTTMVKVQFLDLSKRIARWSFTLSDDDGSTIPNEYIMVPMQKSKNYKVVKEPMRDCWPTDENDTTKTK